MKSFISYPSEQYATARELFEFLSSIGIRPWFDKESLVGGQEWDRERKKAQREADLTFLVLSKETIGRSGVIQREVKDILEALRDKPLGHVFLVTLRIEDVGVPADLARYHYIDYFRADWQVRVAGSVKLKLKELGERSSSLLLEFLRKKASARGSTARLGRQRPPLGEAGREMSVQTRKPDREAHRAPGYGSGVSPYDRIGEQFYEPRKEPFYDPETDYSIDSAIFEAENRLGRPLTIHEKLQIEGDVLVYGRPR